MSSNYFQINKYQNTKYLFMFTNTPKTVNTKLYLDFAFNKYYIKNRKISFIFRRGFSMTNETSYRKHKRLRSQASQAIKIIQNIMDTTEDHNFIFPENLINEKVRVYQFCRDFPKQIQCLFHLLDEIEKIRKKNRLLLTDEQLDEMLLLCNYKVPHAEIARRFNISYPTVKKYFAISQNRKEKEDENSGN